MALTPKQLSVILPQALGEAKADGLAGHFIAAADCQFALHHHILSEGGKRYRVSTLGYYLTQMDRDAGIKHWQPMGSGPEILEMMVFTETDKGLVSDLTELECERHMDSIEATAHHYRRVEYYREER